MTKAVSVMGTAFFVGWRERMEMLFYLTNTFIFEDRELIGAMLNGNSETFQGARFKVI